MQGTVRAWARGGSRRRLGVGSRRAHLHSLGNLPEGGAHPQATFPHVTAPPPGKPATGCPRRAPLRLGDCSGVGVGLSSPERQKRGDTHRG